MLPTALFALSALPLLVSAHFKLVYPPARGFDEDTLGNGPCGGQPASANANRTIVSLSSFPVALDMGHGQSVVQMLLGLGNEPDSHFNITLEHTFGQQGEGSFCLPSLAVPRTAGIADGTNATLQVVTDGDSGGGLYNCADITFTTATEPMPSSCVNGTGVTASTLPSNEASLNANDSSATGGSESGGSASGTTSGSTAQPTSGAAFTTTAWSVAGLAVLGAAVLL